MSRLEEKLQELGYEAKGSHYVKHEYNKNYDYNLVIVVNISDFSISNYYLYPNDRLYITSKDNLEEIKKELQQAFNEMQKDLAILKEIEKDELEL